MRGPRTLGLAYDLGNSFACLPHCRVYRLTRTHGQLALAPGERGRSRLRRIGLRIQILFGLLQFTPSRLQRLVRSFQGLLALLQVAQGLFQTEVASVHQRARPIQHRRGQPDAGRDVESVRATGHAILEPESGPQLL